MSDRERSQPKGRNRGKAEEEAAESTETAADIEALDDLLEEIDTVLEENAEEFVKNYVQKGGE
jgi:prokaryotic ubiquitin-like protein Pup